MKKTTTNDLIFASMFMGIMLLMFSFPVLGFIPLGPIHATTLHIPVIIASIVLGPKFGAFLGGFFGVLSMINSTVRVTLTSFVFSPFISGDFRSVIVAVIPRVIIGILPYYVFNFLQKKATKPLTRHSLSLLLAGFLGSLANTLLVLNFIYLFYMKDYAAAIQKPSKELYGFLMGLVVTTGIPEAIIAAIATGSIAATLLKIKKKVTTRR